MPLFFLYCLFHSAFQKCSSQPISKEPLHISVYRMDVLVPLPVRFNLADHIPQLPIFKVIHAL